jgi:hypothetical protein
MKFRGTLRDLKLPKAIGLEHRMSSSLIGMMAERTA